MSDIETGAPQEEPATPLTPVTRVCRNCATQSQTTAANCPACGKSYVKEPLLTTSRIIALGAVVGVLALLALGMFSWRTYQNNQETAAREAEQAQAVAAREAELQRQADAAAEKRERQEAAARLILAQRKSSVDFIEKSVLKSAQRDSNNGDIEGYPYKMRCNVAPGSSMDNVDKSTTKFVCFAFTSKTLGHYYNVTNDWNTGRFTWKYDNR